MKDQSPFGIASIVVGVINSCLIMVSTYRFGIWLMDNERYKNPINLEGMRIPDNIIILLYFLVAMAIIGFACGLLGLVGKKKKLASIIGTTLNGLFIVSFIFKFLLSN